MNSFGLILALGAAMTAGLTWLQHPVLLSGLVDHLRVLLAAIPSHAPPFVMGMLTPIKGIFMAPLAIDTWFGPITSINDDAVGAWFMLGMITLLDIFAFVRWLLKKINSPKNSTNIHESVTEDELREQRRQRNHHRKFPRRHRSVCWRHQL